MWYKMGDIMRKFILLAAAFLAAPLFFAYGDTSERDLPKRPELDIEKTAGLILAYTNEERSRQGLQPLRRDAVLDGAALIHAKYLARSGVLSHTETKLTYPKDRVRAACPEDRPECVGDYSETPKGPGRYIGCCGENVIESFANNTNGMPFFVVGDKNGSFRTWKGTVRWFTEEDLARDMVARWMNSPPHRMNILMAKYSVMGVGIIWDGRERYFGVQVFGPLKDGLK